MRTENPVAVPSATPEQGNPGNKEAPLKRVLSGIQPTSDLHIGNYFGAVQNWVSLQATHNCIFGIVDLHAMTMPFDPEELRTNTTNMFRDLLACGLNPEKSTLFIQSFIPEHSELAWILGCFCPYGELSRMTQFKEKKASLHGRSRDDSVSAGLFTYPVLQAADILLYRGTDVPVGKDQAQHLELSREIARRFNTAVGRDIFPEPVALLTKTPKIMSLADPEKKMSKSAGPMHYVGLFEDEDSIRRKVRSAVTDGAPTPGKMSPGVANLFTILQASGATDRNAELLHDYEAGSLKYGHLKTAVADALVALTSRLRDRRAEIAESGLDPLAIATESSLNARRTAAETMALVRERVGLPRRR